MDKLSDEELIYNIRLGNREAEELLYFRFEKKLGKYMMQYRFLFEKYGYAFEDIRATIWEMVNKSLPGYCLNEGPFYSYCLLYAKRMIVDMCRKKTYEDNHIRLYDNEDDEINYCDCFKDESIDLDNQVYLNEIYSIVKQMGEDYYKLLVLMEEKYSYNEMAKELNVSRKKIDNMILIMRKKLRKILDEDEM